MKIISIIAFVLGLSFLITGFVNRSRSKNTTKQVGTVYDYTVKTITGEEVSLSDYKDKVVLIVNTASECGFTPQYKELETLFNTYKVKGFTILAFPSNDFGGQEPLNGQEITSFCQKNYGVSFPVFDKIVVKGDQAHPLYKFLADKKANGEVGIAPKWNFHKYLIDKQGRVVTYYFSTTSPTSDKVINKVEELLAQ